MHSISLLPIEVMITPESRAQVQNLALIAVLHHFLTLYASNHIRLLTMLCIFKTRKGEMAAGGREFSLIIKRWIISCHFQESCLLQHLRFILPPTMQNRQERRREEDQTIAHNCMFVTHSLVKIYNETSHQRFGSIWMQAMHDKGFRTWSWTEQTLQYNDYCNHCYVLLNN